MRFKRLVSGIAIAASFVVAAGTARPEAKAVHQKHPDVLFIIIDDIGVDQMRSFGYGLNNQAITPTIDAIAEAGVRFRNAWAMPECSPSRVSFFTGRYPLRTGALNITLNNTLANSQMSPFETTIPLILRDQGYKSGFFGKWHHTAFASNDPNGNPNPGNPLANAAPRDMGWDYFEGMLEGAPRGIDTTAGGVAEPGTYDCGFVTDASYGACWLNKQTCTVLGAPNAPPSADPGRTCLEQGGILVPHQTCDSELPQSVVEGFKHFNGYYVAPLLINHENGSTEIVAGFDDHGEVIYPLDPRARQYLTQKQTDAAIAWIQRQQSSGRPWMATVSYSAAHLPAQQPPRSIVDSDEGDCTTFLGQRKLVDKMFEALDREIGRLLVETGLATRNAAGELQYSPRASNVMIVLVGDNGSYLNTVRLPFDPTRAKGTVYQTGVWVPLIVSGPLVNWANVGREIPHMVNAAVDVFALFGEIAGIDVRKAVPSSHRLDAQALLPYLTNPRQGRIRETNFTQTGTVLQAPGVVPPCLLSIGPQKVCTQVFTFQELCETEGGEWFGELSSCCELKAQIPDVTILPYASTAVRDDRYKLVRNEIENCTTGNFDLEHEFYEINEASPVPQLDRAQDNLLSTPTLNLQELTPDEREHFYRLLMEMWTTLNSEGECPGDGNLDKQVDLDDIRDWVTFADICAANPNRCSSVYDFNLDAVTNEQDLNVIMENFQRRCRGFRPSNWPVTGRDALKGFSAQE